MLEEEWSKTIHDLLAATALASGNSQACEQIIGEARRRVEHLFEESHFGYHTKESLLKVLKVPAEGMPSLDKLPGLDLVELKPSADGTTVVGTCLVCMQYIGNGTYINQHLVNWRRHINDPVVRAIIKSESEDSEADAPG